MVLGPSLLARVVELMRWEGVALVTAFVLAAWLINRVLGKRWKESRRRLLADQFRTLRDFLAVGALVWAVGQGLNLLDAPAWLVISVGFLALVAWLHIGVLVARIFVLQWLFTHSARSVPLLLVDIFTLVASVVVFGMLLHAVFLVEVTSLVATSAVVSVVLGLALQDTLGQLFAGISLQLDRPFQLGDWVEVRLGSETVVGQIQEVSWRATSLLAIGDELITVPNRTMAQGVVLNFSGRDRPFVRRHTFRLPLDAPLELARQLLVSAALDTKGIVADPAPMPLLIETTESWITIRMIYFMVDYGNQYIVGDAYQTKALALLAANGIVLAAPRIMILDQTQPAQD